MRATSSSSSSHSQGNRTESGESTESRESTAWAAAELSRAVDEYRTRDNLGVLLDRVRALAGSVDAAALAAAAEPHLEMPEVVIPVYEQVVDRRPDDARALVILANAYWITGRGPEVVGELATRATRADPANRGAWHLWALSESNVRQRVERWREVSRRFPGDQLARAALADNAVSLAGGEHDPQALALAIETYEGLLREAETGQQRSALERTLATLRGWDL